MGDDMSSSVVAIAEDVPASLIPRDSRMIAFVRDDISGAALRTGFEGSDKTLEVKRGNIRDAIRLLQNDTEFHSVIVDVSGVDDPLEALEDLSRVCPQDVQVALIGDNADIDFYRAIMDEGVTEYMSKPLTRDRVQTVLRPKLLGDVTPEADRGGHVVSVVGAQGGAGTTTCAVSLALLLAETTKAKVALLDLHLQGGETAVMLGVNASSGLRIALEDPMRADTLFLERVAVKVNERVRLISADEKPDEVLQITEAGMRHVLGLLRRRFNYIVVDTPATLSPPIKAVIAQSRHVLVLLESEVTGLRNASQLREAVTNIVGENRVFSVLNRSNRRGGLSQAHIAQGLHAQPDFVIPDLGSGMVEALNEGKLAIDRVKQLRRHLAPIVQEIAGIKTRSTSWLGRLFGR